MASGIEIAGLTLAVLPLFISALEHYNESLDPIKAFWEFDTQLPIQIRKLRNQHVHYEQTLRLLLFPIADPDRVAAMIAEPNGDLWSDEEMQKMLEERLEESYHAYHETITHMEDIMKRIAKDLKIDDSEKANRTNLQSLLQKAPRKNGKFEFMRRVKFGMSKKKLKVLLNDLDECNKELERFTDKSERLEPYRASSKPAFNPPLSQIRAYASSLYNVLCIGMSCQSSHRARLKLEERLAASRRKQAEDRVYSAPCFKVSLSANTATESPSRPIWMWKDAQVRIMEDNKTLDDGKIPDDDKKLDNNERLDNDKILNTHNNPSFNAAQLQACQESNPSETPGTKPWKHSTSSIVLKSTGSSTINQKMVGWALPSNSGDVVKVTYASSTFRTDDLHPVTDICSAIKHDKWSPACLGFCLYPRNGNLRGVYSVASPQMSKQKTTVTLDQVLKAQYANNTKDSRKLSRKDRMTLAVILASSYLQLQATPWLPDSWGTKDIVFESTEAATSSPHFDVEQPYILQCVRSNTEGSNPGPGNHKEAESDKCVPNSTTPDVAGNFSLLGLGILLMELYTGESFEQHEKKMSARKMTTTITGPGDQCPSSIVEAKDEVIVRLLKLSEASKWARDIQDDLSEAYARAVRHCIRSYFDDTSGKDEKMFRQAVLEQVVLPLQDELHTFLGGSRRTR